MSRLAILPLLPLVILCPEFAPAAAPPPFELSSVFPIGVQAGTGVELEIRGTSMAGAYGVEFETSGIRAEMVGTSEADKARIRVDVPAGTPARFHSFRLVSPLGVSNSLFLLVSDYATVQETADPHPGVEQAQVVKQPALVNARLSADGETDFYAFDAEAGQEIGFQVLCKPPSIYEVFWNKPILDAQLTLFEPVESWFSKNGLKFLAYSDEPVSHLVDTTPVLTYRFERAGRYVLSVGSFLGRGNADYSYQLRIAPTALLKPMDTTPTTSLVDTRLKSFIRKISSDYIERILDRTAAAPEGAITTPTLVSATEPNDQKEQAIALSLPALIEGSIDKADDVDTLRFTASKGDRLAFEIETPVLAPPRFAPHISVTDADGRELFTNVYRRIGRNYTIYLKDLEAKTLFTFDHDGDYWLHIRNVTAQAHEDFQYRLLVRPQVPHVGRVELHESQPLNAQGYIWKFGEADRVNLEQGTSKRLLLLSYFEEGFKGNVAVRVLDCPPGVQVLPGTELNPDPLPPIDEGKKDQYIPKIGSGTLAFWADPDAPLTREPQTVRIVFHAIVNGKVGPMVEIGKLPLMVAPKAAPPPDAVVTTTK